MVSTRAILPRANEAPGRLEPPDRFDADHRRVVAALESLRRHGYRGAGAAASVPLLRLSIRFLVELVARYVVVSHVKNVVAQMRNLYWLREMEFRLSVMQPLAELWRTIGNCGGPPKDQSDRFAVIAIRQTPHAYDEVYVVLDGSADIEVDGETRSMAQGDAVFVAATPSTGSLATSPSRSSCSSTARTAPRADRRSANATLKAAGSQPRRRALFHRQDDQRTTTGVPTSTKR